MIMYCLPTDILMRNQLVDDFCFVSMIEFTQTERAIVALDSKFLWDYLCICGLFFD
jgi:hypothetical protein